MQYLKFGLAVALSALLLCRPEAAALGALNAMSCWATTVAPAMFPFMALLPALTCEAAGKLYARLLGRPMERLFRLPGGAAAAMVVGMVGGAPAGALAARRVRGLNRGEMKRLGLCACGWSPAFLVGGVGAGMLGEASLGHVLLRSQLAVQLLMPLLLRGAWRADNERVFALPAPEEEQPIRAAVAAILNVCGWMALFGALGRAARALAGDKWVLPAVCVVDAISGMQYISRTNMDVVMKITVLAALCGFGGGCIAFQNLSILKQIGVKAREYIAVRLLAAFGMALLTRLQLAVNCDFYVSLPLESIVIPTIVSVALAFIPLVSMKKTITLQCFTCVQTVAKQLKTWRIHNI